MDISRLAKEQQEYMVEIRRYLHQRPELSHQEEKTSQKICEELTSMGISYEIVGDYNVVATIEGKRKDVIVALRADMDALPVTEETGLPFASQKPGIMHACGHDGHVAMLLGAARIFQQVKGEMNGTVKLCFQQAEETGGGALEILENLEAHPVKTAFGIHLWADFETGKISVEPGPRMAAADGLRIEVNGKGTHAAYPSKGVDPIITSAAILSNLTAMVAREANPLYPSVLAFGAINGGELGNVIPERVTIKGGLRSTNNEQRARLMQAIRRIVEGTAATYNTTAEVIREGGVPIVFNDEFCSAVATTAAEKVGGQEAVSPLDLIMASENYGFFVDRYPGIYAFIGVRNEKINACYPHHHPKFDIDEATFFLGAGLHVQYTLDFLNQYKD